MLKSIISLLFVFLLNLPSLISLEHFFDDNHHQVCVEGKVHFHEKESVCVSCEFIRNFQDIELDQSHFVFIDNQSFVVYFILIIILMLIYYGKNLKFLSFKFYFFNILIYFRLNPCRKYLFKHIFY